MCVCVCHFLLHASSGACLCVTVTRGARAHSQCLHTSLTYICRWVRSAWREQTEMCADDDPVKLPQMPPSTEEFEAEGYVTLGNLVSPAYCSQLNARLERVLRGEFDTGLPPDKVPPFKAEERVKPGKTAPPLGGPSKRTLQCVNIWKADRTFAALVKSPTLGRMVAELAGWPSGARVANDQVWAKPPGGAPLTFHRDSPYLDFVPNDVVTVWIALDDMDDELGPLEYCVRSHLWGDGRVGTASQFFDVGDRFALLYDAARREGIKDPEASLRIERLSVKMGGCGIHNGRLWHGSGKNASANRPRRGLGIHYVPAEARFRDASANTTLAHRDRAPDGSNELPTKSFPIVWAPAGEHSRLLTNHQGAADDGVTLSLRQRCIGAVELIIAKAVPA